VIKITPTETSKFRRKLFARYLLLEAGTHSRSTRYRRRELVRALFEFVLAFSKTPESKKPAALATGSLLFIREGSLAMSYSHIGMSNIDHTTIGETAFNSLNAEAKKVNMIRWAQQLYFSNARKQKNRSVNYGFLIIY